MDIHLGGGGGVEMAENMFNTYPNYTMGAVNAETNAGIHTMTRAVRILPLSLLAASRLTIAGGGGWRAHTDVRGYGLERLVQLRRGGVQPPPLPYGVLLRRALRPF